MKLERELNKLFWQVKYQTLATYNSECARGIVHTKEYDIKMSRIQQEYDADLESIAGNL